MDQRQWASVLFAVLGVFIVFSRLPELVFSIALLTQLRQDFAPASGPSGGVLRLLSFTAVLVSTLFGVALIALRERLAVWLFPAGSGPLAIREAQAVAFSVLGCYFIVQGAHSIGSWWYRESRYSGVLMLVLGLVLFLGARGLAALWTRLRTAAAD